MADIKGIETNVHTRQTGHVPCPYGRKVLHSALTVPLLLTMGALPSSWEWSVSCPAVFLFLYPSKSCFQDCCCAYQERPFIGGF